MVERQKQMMLAVPIELPEKGLVGFSYHLPFDRNHKLKYHWQSYCAAYAFEDGSLLVISEVNAYTADHADWYFAFYELTYFVPNGAKWSNTGNIHFGKDGQIILVEA